MAAKKPASLSVAQRRVLRALVAAGGSKLLVGGELPHRTVQLREDRGWLKIERGGTISKCPRSGVDVFTPGPSTAVITDAGRAIELRDRTGIEASS